jgi:hypothetical protein
LVDKILLLRKKQKFNVLKFLGRSFRQLGDGMEMIRNDLVLVMYDFFKLFYCVLVHLIDLEERLQLTFHLVGLELVGVNVSLQGLILLL